MRSARRAKLHSGDARCDTQAGLALHAHRLQSDGVVRAADQRIGAYTNVGGVPPPSLLKMAKMGVAIDRWMGDKQLTATAIQCWKSAGSMT